MPPENKAEKLRHDQNGWDRVGQQFVIQMSCKFGIATAGEQGVFTARTTIDVSKPNGDVDQVKGERDIAKVAGEEKDAEGYIKIEPTAIKWDTGYVGDVDINVSSSVVGPSGNVVGGATVTSDKVTIEPPGDVPGDEFPG